MEDDNSRNPSPSSPASFWLHRHHQRAPPASRPGRTWSGASNSSATSSTGGDSALSPLKPWILILVIAVVILFVLPHPLSSGSSARAGGGMYPGAASRPSASVVKSGWGAVNAALVLFAIICGLLGRAGGENQEAQEQHQRLEAAGRSLLEGNPPAPDAPQHLRAPASPRVWYGYPATQPLGGYTIPGPPPPAEHVEIGVPVRGSGMRLRRSSSSYPDLRQEHWVQANEWRFSDDFGIQEERDRRQDIRHDFHLHQTTARSHQAPAVAVDYRSSPHGSARYDGPAARPEVTLRHPRSPPAPPPPPPPKTNLVDRVPPRSPPPPPPTPPPEPSPLRQSRRHRKPSRESFAEPQRDPPSPLLPPPSPAPPPPPPPPRRDSTERTHKRRSSGTAKDIATAIALFYQKRKKRSGGSGGKGKSKSHDDSELQLSLEHDSDVAADASRSIAPPPPPPPPPKSPSFFQLFPNKRSSGKSKRVHSVPATTAPPPPPPPPLPAPAPNRAEPPRSRQTHRPPIPIPQTDDAGAIKITYRKNDFTYGESIFRPPPPPPPSVPESPTGTPRSKGGLTIDDDEEQGDSARSTSQRPAAFCPSPDVNSKADLFIARLRDGWRLEKLKSLEEKEQKQGNHREGGAADVDADVGAGDREQRPP